METGNKLSAVIALIYRHAVGSTDETLLLKQLTQYTAARSGWIWVHDFRAGESKVHEFIGFDGAYVESYIARYAKLNPWLKDQGRYSRPGAVVTGCDIVKRRNLVKTEFYAEWLEPQDLCHRIAGVLSVDGKRITAFEFLRGPAAPAFGLREAALCRELLPHWRAAKQMREVVIDIETERDAAWQLLERLPFGVALVNDACEPVATNRYLSELLASANGLTSRRNGLCASSHSESDALHELVAQVTSRPADEHGAAEGIMTLSRDAGQRPLQVMVLALPNPDGAAHGAGVSAAVFILNPDQPIGPNQGTLRRLYGLTKSEARLASLVAQGMRLDEATESMGVALSTGRTHLKRIFSKTGTQRQAELVRLLLSGPSLFVEQKAVPPGRLGRSS